MSGRLTAGQIAQVQRATAKVIPVVRITWPEVGNVYYTSAGAPASSARYGPISPQVEQWDDITYSLPDYRGGLEGIQTGFTLSDLSRTPVAFGATRTIDTLVSGRYSKLIGLHTVVNIFLITEDPATPDILLFAGIIVDAQRISTFRWKVICRTNDGPLMNGSFKIPLIDQYAYPLMSADAGKCMPLPFGWFDSNDGTVVGSYGALKAYKTGLNVGGGFPYPYLAACNWLTSVKRVCVSGVPLANATWVRKYGEARGMAVTELWLASDPGNAPVTYDAFGIGQTVGGGATYHYSYGTGEPIRNPTRQMQWLLLNHVFGSYRPTRLPYGVAPPIGLGDSGTLLDVTSWNASAAFDDQHYFAGCIPPVENPSDSPATLFSEWCRAWGKRPYWTPEGTLALAVDNWDVDPATLTGTRHLRYVRSGTENAFSTTQQARNERVNRLASAAWVLPSSGANRTVSVIGTGEKYGNSVDTFHNRFSECVAELDPTVLPSSVTRAWFVDCATQAGNTYLNSGVDLTQLDAQQYGAATSLITAGANAPLFMTASDNGGLFARPYAKFDVAVGRRMYGQAGDSFGAVATAASHTVWVVFSLQNATLNSGVTVQYNHPLITENTGGYWGIYFKKAGGLYYVNQGAYDGVFRTTPDVQIALNTWYILRARHHAGNQYLSINNWDEVSSVCGNIGVTTGILEVGGANDGRGAIYSDVSIAAVVISDSGDNTAQGNDSFASYPGLHDNYRMYAQLKDRYGL